MPREPTKKICFISDTHTECAILAACYARSLERGNLEIYSGQLEGTPDYSKLEPVLKKNGLTLDDSHRSGITVEELVSADMIICFEENYLSDWDLLPGSPLILQWRLDSAEACLHDAVQEKLMEEHAIKLLVNNLFVTEYVSKLMAYRSRCIFHLDTMDSAILVHDSNRRFTHLNELAEHILGYSREELIGKDCHVVFPWYLCGGKCNFCQGEQHEFDTLWFTTDIHIKDGSRRHVEMSMMPIKDKNDVNRGAVISIRDLSHRMHIQKKLTDMPEFMGIIGKSHAMMHIFETIREVSPTDMPALVMGESGTGKELVANAIHRLSKRSNRPFIVVNCGALADGILESELFGHVRGAFTGALRNKKGRFELANGGTIFLDEVGDLSPMMQVKLLRVLQYGTFERVGDERTITVNVRVISATNRNLEEMISRELFREDLYYRLCVVPIHIPPIRARRDDIPLLVEHFLNNYSADIGREYTWAEDFIHCLSNFSWPGNVRQLQNILQYALIKSRGRKLIPEHLPEDLVLSSPDSEKRRKKTVGRKRKLTRTLVDEALKASNGNKSRAAKLLGVGRATLHRFLKAENKNA